MRPAQLDHAAGPARLELRGWTGAVGSRMVEGLPMWRVEYDPTVRVLRMWIRGRAGKRELLELSGAHAKALEASGGQRFFVLVDLQGLYPLDGEPAAILADIKRVASQLDGYRGRAVVVDSATVAMQLRNTTLEEGGDDRELITWDPAEASRFVRS